MADDIWTAQEPRLETAVARGLGLRAEPMPGTRAGLIVTARARGAVAAALGVSPQVGAMVAAGEARLVWFSKGQWLLINGPAGLADLDQSDGRAFLRLTGPDEALRGALATLVPLDLRPRAFGPGLAAGTEAAHMGVHLWVDSDAQGAMVVWISCFRSFTRSLQGALNGAGFDLV